MAGLSTLARPYAKAAFEFAQSHELLQSWGDMLDLSALIAEDSQMRPIYGDPRVGSEDRSNIFKDVAADNLSDQFKAFIDMLAANDRLAILPEIRSQYAGLRAGVEHTQDVIAISAVELNDEERQRLAKALSKKLDSEVSVEVEIDHNVMGGAVMRAGGLVIDASIRGKLQRLEEALTR